MRFERDQSLVNRVLIAINKPVFAPAISEPNSSVVETSGEKDKKLEEAENRWFLRYLTLRNILIFLWVFVGLTGSVVAFSVNTYDKRATPLNETIEKLGNQKSALEKEISTLQGECGPQLTAVKSELETNKKQVQALNANVSQTNKLLETAQAAAARSDEQANIARKDAAVLQQKLNDLQATPKS